MEQKSPKLNQVLSAHNKKEIKKNEPQIDSKSKPGQRKRPNETEVVSNKENSNRKQRRRNKKQTDHVEGTQRTLIFYNTRSRANDLAKKKSDSNEKPQEKPTEPANLVSNKSSSRKQQSIKSKKKDAKCTEAAQPVAAVSNGTKKKRRASQNKKKVKVNNVEDVQSTCATADDNKQEQQVIKQKMTNGDHIAPANTSDNSENNQKIKPRRGRKPKATTNEATGVTFAKNTNNKKQQRQGNKLNKAEQQRQQQQRGKRVSVTNKENKTNNRQKAGTSRAAGQQNRMRVQQAPNRVQQAPNRVQQAPNRVQQAPNRVQQAPNRVQQAPNRVQQAPNRVQQAPNRVQQALNRVQQAPNRVQQAPHRVQQVPNVERVNSVEIDQNQAEIKVQQELLEALARRDACRREIKEAKNKNDKNLNNPAKGKPTAMNEQPQTSKTDPQSCSQLPFFEMKKREFEISDSDDSTDFDKEYDLDESLTYNPAIEGCRNIKEYRFLSYISEGSYGKVYKAVDKRIKKIVAIKYLKRSTSENFGFDKCFLREINIMMRIKHPHILSIIEVVMNSRMENVFIVMEYIDDDLRNVIKRVTTAKRMFKVEQVKGYMVQILQAVAHLHDNWIFHRDLKPANILITNQGVLKITDFNLAREYTSSIKPYSGGVGTIFYRAPEILLGSKNYDMSCDMWSVGCIFAELITTHTLFPASNQTELATRIFKELGTPNDDIWPGFSALPMVRSVVWPYYQPGNIWRKFRKILSISGFSLLLRFITYDPSRRIGAEAALNDKYFAELPLPYLLD